MIITSGNTISSSQIDDTVSASSDNLVTSKAVANYVTEQLATDGEIANTIDSKIEAAIGNAIGGSY